MKQKDEKLSLLLDDDYEAEMGAVLDEVIADVNLQYRMRRYQMIGAAMRNELPHAIDTAFHDDVMARIRAETGASTRQASREPDSVRPPSLIARSWFRPLAGLAVAASVAVVTVALWQPLQIRDGLSNDALVSADEQKIQQLAGQQITGGAVPVSTRVRDSGTHWKMENGSPVLQQKLNAYLVNHTEYSNSMQGLIPQARVAGFDAQQ
jgi:sigma-E factor negative regulatory protein RseA